MSEDILGHITAIYIKVHIHTKLASWIVFSYLPLLPVMLLFNLSKGVRG